MFYTNGIKLDFQLIEKIRVSPKTLSSDKVYARFRQKDKTITFYFGEEVLSLIGMKSNDQVDIYESPQDNNVFLIKKNENLRGRKLTPSGCRNHFGQLNMTLRKHINFEPDKTREIEYDIYDDSSLIINVVDIKQIDLKQRINNNMRKVK